ncbi:MAG: hypothetical protein AAGM22_03755 [Acidobacteriota bacterium]
MRSFLPLIFVIAAVVGYFVLSGSFGIFQAIPWPHFLVAGGATAWALHRATKLRRVVPILVAILSLALTGLYGWYILSYSAYATTTGAEVGQRLDALATLELDSHAGTPTPVLGDQTTLVVLYRGFW